MDERPVATARASVMMFDSQSNSWVASGTAQGISKVQLFKHQINNTYRVVGWKLSDKEVVLNCIIFRGLKYNQARPTFHQWRDTKHQVYGLNFTSKDEAEIFATAMMEALDSLNQIYKQSQQLIAVQKQQMDMQSQNYPQYGVNNVLQTQIVLDASLNQSYGNTSMPEYAMPQKQTQQPINNNNNIIVENYQSSYTASLSSNGSLSAMSTEYKGAISEDVTVILPTVTAPQPPPPPPGPPPPSSAPPPPPGPPPLSNITLAAKQPQQPQYDSDDDSNQSGLASQLRQARLKSRNTVISEIETMSLNSNKNTITSSATLGRSSGAAAAAASSGSGGGGDMMSEMQRVLAARKKAKVGSKMECTDNNGGSGDNSSKINNNLRQNNHRSPSECDNQSTKTPAEVPGKIGVVSAINLQYATLGRKGSLQPESYQQGTTVTRQDLEIFKREILQEVRSMIQQFKVDIVDAIRTNRP